MPTDRSKRLEVDLERAFTPQRMQYIWSRTVRTGLRNQILPDLHDFLDVHRNIGTYVGHLCARVIAGRYRPSPFEVVTLEKRDGISRRLVLPTPADALVLQTLVEAFEPVLLATQPTKNAYYSRSHVGKGMEDVDESFPYPWWLLWPAFQERIWAFARAHPYVVTTDVANYFDSIPLSSLRNVIASQGTFEASLLDLLFFMLEAFTWRPYYMPMSSVGLPQIDFDAPRLLAHVYLFDADRELNASTKGDFVRWMDDINFGVDSISSARQALGNLETLLNSYGIRLNAGKTDILDSEQAATHFWVQENLQLNVVTNLIRNGALQHSTGVPLREYVLSRYEAFADKERVGHWEKIYKRYFTLLGRLSDDRLEDKVPEILDGYPGLRKAALRYYGKLGFSPQRAATISTYLASGKCVDDASLFESVATLVAMRIPADHASRGAIVELAQALPSHCGSTVTSMIAGLWLLAKYAPSPVVEAYLQDHQSAWSKSDWAARQVAAVTPLVSGGARRAVHNVFSSNGLLDGLAVLTHVEHLQGLQALDPQLRQYLLWPPTPGFGYPLYKVLITIALLRGNLGQPDRSTLATALPPLMTDEVYDRLIAERATRADSGGSGAAASARSPRARRRAT